MSNSKAVIAWRVRIKSHLLEGFKSKCGICSYNKYQGALELHHLDPKEKDFSISGKTLSFEKMKKEVDKCILVCSNCHSEIHSETNT
jgi:5-methylcytosine-specific restriction endonuclease McrA